jgi:hypothetical protein
VGQLSKPTLKKTGTVQSITVKGLKKENKRDNLGKFEQ